MGFAAELFPAEPHMYGIRNHHHHLEHREDVLSLEQIRLALCELAAGNMPRARPVSSSAGAFGAERP